jgi:hypothetical protein
MACPVFSRGPVTAVKSIEALLLRIAVVLLAGTYPMADLMSQGHGHLLGHPLDEGQVWARDLEAGAFGRHGWGRA